MIAHTIDLFFSIRPLQTLQGCQGSLFQSLEWRARKLQCESQTCFCPSSTAPFITGNNICFGDPITSGQSRQIDIYTWHWHVFQMRLMWPLVIEFHRGQSLWFQKYIHFTLPQHVSACSCHKYWEDVQYTVSGSSLLSRTHKHLHYKCDFKCGF